MGSGKGLVGVATGGYHHTVDVLDRDVTADTVVDLTILASRYADEVISSLPENDPEVLKKGLEGAFLYFLGDAVGVLA
jgi:hypothetical protein